MAKLSSTQIYGNLDVLGEIKNKKLNSHFLDLSHVYYVEATGSNNTYIANIGIGLDKYVAGLGIAVKIPDNSTGNSTVNVDGLGAVTIKKANGNNATNLKKNSVYSMRLSKDDNGLWYFFLQGEGGSGNATASDILTGKTASVDAGDIVGTMIDYGNKEVSSVITTNRITKIKFTDDKCGEICNKLNINGYVDNNTVIRSYCYGVHPECVKTGQLIGAGGLGYIGSYDKESTNPINAASILASKVGYVNGNKIIGTMPTVTGTLSGDSTSTAFKNSSIVGAQSNNDVSGFDYDITGYVNKPRVHIPNIIPKNIKAGVKIGSEKANIIGTFTSDANAAAGDILAGKTGYVNGNKITGNIPVQKEKCDIIQAGVKVGIPAGYYPKAGYIQAGPLDDQTRGNATANDMLIGKNAWVNGSQITGTISSQPPTVNATSRYINQDWAYFRFPKGAYINTGENQYPEVRLETKELLSTLNITPNKILMGQNCIGVSGTATNDGTASAIDIREGEIAYSKGKRFVGTRPRGIFSEIKGTSISNNNNGIHQTIAIKNYGDGVDYNNSTLSGFRANFSSPSIATTDNYMLFGKCIYNSYIYKGVTICTPMFGIQGFSASYSVVYKYLYKDGNTSSISLYWSGFIYSTEHRSNQCMPMPNGANVEWYALCTNNILGINFD